MKTSDFLATLAAHPNKALTFEYKNGQYARADYHLTEFKNVTFDTVDCGGVSNEWQEVHVQLWENEILEPNHRVDTSKALKIFKTVQRVRPTLADAEIKFEYGNANFHTAILPVAAIETTDHQIIVKLHTENTTCKAKDRAITPEGKASACCVSSSSAATTNENSCCSPEEPATVGGELSTNGFDLSGFVK